ncbi:DUF2059 domain-containing protein [bacterium]|jgi:hypothetical protein|nr:DUF2059 domain-containing protein [bacterium]
MKSKVCLLCVFLIPFSMVEVKESDSLKEKLVKAIVTAVVDRKKINQKKTELVGRIIENLKKADQVLIRDMLEWKQSEREEKELEKRFFDMEADAFAKLKRRLDSELDLYRLMLRNSAGFYHKHFTIDELKILRKFYATEAGKKTLKLSELAYERGMSAIDKHVIPLATKISKEVQKELIEDFMVQEP